jgi:hypothetical protein
VDLATLEHRRGGLHRKWRLMAMPVPLAFLLGELFYGTFATVDDLYWGVWIQPMFLVVMIQIFTMRVVRHIWVVPWKSDDDPTGPEAERIYQRAVRYLWFSWSMSSIQAGMGLFLLLTGAPRMFAWFFPGIALVYLLLFAPRLGYFLTLLPHLDAGEPVIRRPGNGPEA